jgi:hypothetical protein
VDEPVSNFAFNFKLRHYMEEMQGMWAINATLVGGRAASTQLNPAEPN